MNNDCYCGKPLHFEQCCKPKHLGTEPAKTAEELMRSRYSAFCSKNTRYLMQTLAPHKRNTSDENEIKQSMVSTQWHRLKVIEQSQKGDEGCVEFVAFFSSQGKPGQVHEKSKFIKQAGLWYYVDGVQLPPLKPRRNDPCPCGSEKKFKSCCLK